MCLCNKLTLKNLYPCLCLMNFRVELGGPVSLPNIMVYVDDSFLLISHKQHLWGVLDHLRHGKTLHGDTCAIGCSQDPMKKIRDTWCLFFHGLLVFKSYLFRPCLFQRWYVSRHYWFLQYINGQYQLWCKRFLELRDLHPSGAQVLNIDD